MYHIFLVRFLYFLAVYCFIFHIIRLCHFQSISLFFFHVLCKSSTIDEFHLLFHVSHHVMFKIVITTETIGLYFQNIALGNIRSIPSLHLGELRIHPIFPYFKYWLQKLNGSTCNTYFYQHLYQTFFKLLQNPYVTLR